MVLLSWSLSLSLSCGHSHMVTLLSHGHSPLTWSLSSHMVTPSHVTLLSHDHSPLTWSLSSHIVTLSHGHFPLTWSLSSHLVTLLSHSHLLSPGHSPLTWSLSSHMVTLLSHGHSHILVTLTWSLPRCHSHAWSFSLMIFHTHVVTLQW